MYFIDNLQLQLILSIGMTIEVATDTSLFEGILLRVSNGIIELSESVVGYEREARHVIISISSINFIRM